MTAKFEGEKESVLADSRAGLGEMRKEWQSIPSALNNHQAFGSSKPGEERRSWPTQGWAGAMAGGCNRRLLEVLNLQHS